MSILPPTVVCRVLVLCAIALLIALFTTHWATNDTGAESKYIADHVTVGLFSVEGRRSYAWEDLADKQDVKVPAMVELARVLSIGLGFAAAAAILASAFAAAQRRAPTTRWARRVIQSAFAMFIGWLGALMSWDGYAPGVSGVLAIAATAAAGVVLGRVPVRSQLPALSRELMPSRNPGRSGS